MEGDIIPAMGGGDQFLRSLPALIAQGRFRRGPGGGFDWNQLLQGVGRQPTASDLQTIQGATKGQPGAPAWLTGGMGAGGQPGAPAGAAPAPFFSTEGIMAKLEQGWSEAKTANEDRYKNLLGILYRRRDYGRQLMEGFGNTALSEAGTSHRQELDAASESAQQRGLHNSGVLDALRRGENTRYGKERADILERTSTAKAQMDASLTGDIAGAVERRTDEYPDTKFWSDLILGKTQADAQNKSNTTRDLLSLLGAGAGMFSIAL